jgi:hypothetical protein
MTEEALARALDMLVPHVVAEPDWDDVLGRATAPTPLRRNRRLWYALAAAAVLLALLVSPAFGLGHRLVDLFTGSPAPKPVKRELSFGTNTSDKKIAELMHQQVDSKVRLGEARGLMEVSTPVGALRIWGAPTSDGGLCTYMLLAGASHGWLACDTPSKQDDEMFIGAADARTAGGRTVRFVSGQAGERITSVELRLAGGSMLPVRMVRPFFFRALQPGQQSDALVGRDAAGNIVGKISVDMASPPPGVLPPRLPIGPSNQLVSLDTKIGRVTFSVAPGPDGDHCWIVHAPTGGLNACRPVSKAIELDYGPYYNRAQTHFVIFLSGFVRPDVRSLELLFEDGESAEIDLLVGDYFLQQLPERNWSKGHRPTLLVARDQDGNVLSRRRVE